MPKLMAAKSYPAFFDLYTPTITQEETGGSVTIWNYTDPETFTCTVTSIRPESNLESFGTTYTDSEFLRLETSADPMNFSLDQRVGNLRSKHGVRYYRSPAGRPLVFEVNGISPQIDASGGIVCVALFCRLAGQQPTSVAQA